MEDKNHNVGYLTDKQIPRLLQVVDTHYRIEKAYYMGNDCFKVITDKRRFIAKLNPRLTNFVINGIQLERDEKK